MYLISERLPSKFDRTTRARREIGARFSIARTHGQPRRAPSTLSGILGLPGEAHRSSLKVGALQRVVLEHSKQIHCLRMAKVPAPLRLTLKAMWTTIKALPWPTNVPPSRRGTHRQRPQGLPARGKLAAK
jgi:hypothetical protein